MLGASVTCMKRDPSATSVASFATSLTLNLGKSLSL